MAGTEPWSGAAGARHLNGDPHRAFTDRFLQSVPEPEPYPALAPAAAPAGAPLIIQTADPDQVVVIGSCNAF
jgi:hypothetical protein